MELYCKDVQTSLQDSHLCAIANGHLYCTALLKVACHLPQNRDSSNQQSRETSPHMDGDSPALSSARTSIPRNGGTQQLPQMIPASVPRDSGANQPLQTVPSSVPRDSILHQSKQRPIDIPGARKTKSPPIVSSSLPVTAPLMVPPGKTAFVRRRRSSKDVSISSFNDLPISVTPYPGLGTSMGESSLASWSVITEGSLRSWVIVSSPKSDSELSGYEADIEKGGTNQTEVGESADELEESQLLSSLTSYLVPSSVQQRLWLMRPVLYCIELLREGMKGGMGSNW